MIIYFSGTGNTRRCALELAKILGDSNVHALAADELRHPAAAIIDAPEGEKRVIWMFPTYSWGIPPVVADVMAGCSYNRAVREAMHIMVTTCGDDMAHTDCMWRRIMHGRGLRTAGAYTVIMPNTYTAMKGFDVDSPEVAQQKLDASAARIAEVADAIMHDGPSMTIPGSFPFIKTAVIYPWFKRFAMSSKPFHALASCIGCGLCARSCPMENIAMVDGRPRWDTACALCLRCYHICPQHAVAYGKSTDGKGQWICPQID